VIRVFALLVHADRAKHAIVQQQDDAFAAVLHGSGQLLTVHQKITITRNRERHATRQHIGGNARWHPVAHGPCSRSQLCLVALDPSMVLEKAVNPTREITCAIGQHRIDRQMFL
jgi:hypothetical protein